MKGIYLSNLDPNQAKGYENKILGQIEGFQKLGIDMQFIGLAVPNRIILRDYSDHQIIEKQLGFFGKNIVTKRLTLLTEARKIINQNQPDFIYLRYPRSEPLFIYFLSQIKKHHPQLVIVSEIPTYPYDQEYQNSQSKRDKLLLILDKLTRQYLKKYINIITVVCYQGLVFGIPSVNINNGIIIDNIPLQKPITLNNELHLIGLGNIYFWHGYDRIIRGLFNYYQESQNTIKIFFHLVSPNSEEINQLKSITQELNLSNYLQFHNSQYGQKLDAIFDICHLAVGDLGSHRKGLKTTAALKVREYVARGIPFINSVEDPDFSDNFPYLLKVPADDTPINIQEVIEFAHKIYQDSQHIVKIREYAAQNLDWSVKLKRVVEEIKKYIN